jgi:hypothetical protein
VCTCTCVHNRLGEQVSLECSQQRPGPAHGTCRPNPTSHPAAYSPLQRSPPVQDTAKTYETRTRPEEKKKQIPFLSIFLGLLFLILGLQWNGMGPDVINPPKPPPPDPPGQRPVVETACFGTCLLVHTRSGQVKVKVDVIPTPNRPGRTGDRLRHAPQAADNASLTHCLIGSVRPPVTGRSPWVQPLRLGQSISDLARGLGWAGPRRFGGRPISAGLGRVEEAKSNGDVGQTTAEAR